MMLANDGHYLIVVALMIRDTYPNTINCPNFYLGAIKYNTSRRQYRPAGGTQELSAASVSGVAVY